MSFISTTSGADNNDVDDVVVEVGSGRRNEKNVGSRRHDDDYDAFYYC